MNFSMASASSATCTSCSKPAANKCGGCKTLSYCSKDCQSKDWPNHKATCKDVQLEKRLTRICGIIQQAYLEFTEATWDTPILRVEENGRTLVVYDGDQRMNKDYFLPFPEDLMVNKHMKMAIICAWKCGEALAWTHNVLARFLEGKTGRLLPKGLN